MQIRLTRDGVRVRGIVVTSCGDVLDIPQSEAEHLIMMGDAVLPEQPKPAEPEQIIAREPIVENRDPKPVRVRRSKII